MREKKFNIVKSKVTAALAIGLLASGLVGDIFGQTGYRGEVEKWRIQHEEELKTEDGWLTVVGLFWLKEGRNTIGTGSGYDVELTDNFKRGKFGEIDLRDGKASITVAEGVDATVDGRPANSAELTFDQNGKPKLVAVGSQSFFLIKRGDKFAIRLRDTNSEARRNFKHLNWYPIDPKARIIAKFEKYPEPKEVLIPNVLGGTFTMTAPGLLRFTIGGKEVTLEPVDEDGRLFIIFRDLTSKTETYGSGRFLYADAPVNGEVVLDFNRAENPPCAFTDFATCPLPPQQNRLNVAIKAGEKRYRR
jgi:uncharacterized protein (DUF1684 family)